MKNALNFKPPHPALRAILSRWERGWVCVTGIIILLFTAVLAARQAQPQTPGSSTDKHITAAECTVTRLGNSIPVASIGEPVSGVSLRDPRWVEATGNTPAYCSIDGAMVPVDP